MIYRWERTKVTAWNTFHTKLHIVKKSLCNRRHSLGERYLVLHTLKKLLSFNGYTGYIWEALACCLITIFRFLFPHKRTRCEQVPPTVWLALMAKISYWRHAAFCRHLWPHQCQPRPKLKLLYNFNKIDEVRKVAWYRSRGTRVPITNMD